MSDSERSLPLLPLRSLVVFPGTTLSVPIGRLSSLKLVEELEKSGNDLPLLVGAQKDTDIEEPGLRDLHPVCVEARVLRIIRAPGAPLTLLLRGLGRRRIVTLVRDRPYLVAMYEPVSEPLGNSASAETLRGEILAAISRLVDAEDLPQAVAEALQDPGDTEVSDLASSLLHLASPHHLSVLGALEIATRRYMVLLALEERLELLGGGAA